MNGGGSVSWVRGNHTIKGGVQVFVVDAASIPVARQARRCKTDRLDALKLLISEFIRRVVGGAGFSGPG